MKVLEGRIDEFEFLLIEGRLEEALDLLNGDTLPIKKAFLINGYFGVFTLFSAGFSPNQKDEHDVKQLIMGVCCLMTFIIHNFTIDFRKQGYEEEFQAEIKAAAEIGVRFSLSTESIEIDGEDAFPARLWFFLLFAEKCFESCKGFHSSEFWKSRAWFTHQRFLSNVSETLQHRIKTSSEAFQPTDKRLQALAALESLSHHIYFQNVTRAKLQLSKAEEVCGSSIKFKGEMAKATQHQIDAKAQLIAFVDRSANFLTGNRNFGYKPKNVLIGGDYLLEDPKLVSETAEDKTLSEYELMLCMAHVNLILLENVNKDLRQQQILACARLVLQNNLHVWSISSSALYFRSIIEKTSWHHQQRSYEQFESLVDTLKEPPSKERLDCIFTSFLPSFFELATTFAEFCESLSLNTSALDLYESLGMWEQTMLCYVKSHRAAKAEEMIRTRIENEINPKPLYFCVLGDILEDPSYYEKAWEVSNKRYPRAKRSLGTYYFYKDDFAQSIGHFEEGLRLNGAFQRCWYRLGYAALQLKEWKTASRAFSRAVSLNAQDGEAWNNLSCVYLETKEWELAFSALKQSVKFKRDDWKIWENYLLCSVHLSSLQDSLNAIDRVAELKGADQFDLSIFGALSNMVLNYSGDSVTERSFLIERFKSIAVKIGGYQPDRALFYEICVNFYNRLKDSKGSADNQIALCRMYQRRDESWETRPDICEAVVQALQTLYDIISEGKIDSLYYPALLQTNAAITRTENELRESPDLGRLRKLLELFKALSDEKEVYPVAPKENDISSLYSSSLWM